MVAGRIILSVSFTGTLASSVRGRYSRLAVFARRSPAQGQAGSGGVLGEKAECAEDGYSWLHLRAFLVNCGCLSVLLGLMG